MPTPVLYATRDDLKARLGIPDTDTRYDTLLDEVLDEASRLVELETGRVFAATTDAVRYYQALTDAVRLDDTLSVTEVALDDGTGTYPTIVDPTQYFLEPADGPPYTLLRLAPVLAWPLDPAGATWRRGVRVTGDVGACATNAVPTPVRSLTLLLAMRLFQRREAPLGLSGNAETGMVRISSVDPDIRRHIQLLRRKRLA